jgi:hypothetical protein
MVNRGGRVVAIRRWSNGKAPTQALFEPELPQL